MFKRINDIYGTFSSSISEIVIGTAYMLCKMFEPYQADKFLSFYNNFDKYEKLWLWNNLVKLPLDYDLPASFRYWLEILGLPDYMFYKSYFDFSPQIVQRYILISAKKFSEKEHHEPRAKIYKLGDVPIKKRITEV